MLNKLTLSYNAQQILNLNKNSEDIMLNILAVEYFLIKGCKAVVPEAWIHLKLVTI